jgi:hypothetical protein
MNYVELINNIWQLREQAIISVHEADLYLYLVHRSNKLGWKNPFNQSTEIICAFLGINRNALTNRRNKLQQLGLIKFREGTTKGRPAEYELCSLKDTQHNTQTYTQCDTYTINKTKLNKTKEVDKEKPTRFLPPPLEEIKIYCEERKNSVDPQRFLDFYQAKNWMIGKNKMKDWRAAVRTWEKGDNNNGRTTTNKRDNSLYRKEHIINKLGEAQREWEAKNSGEGVFTG